MADTQDPAHILAIAPNWLGDAVMCTPALRATKHRFPQSTLTVAGQPAICTLLEGLPWIDRLHPLASLRGLFSLLTVGSVFAVAMTISAQPTALQLYLLGIYAAFVLLVHVAKRR